MVSETTDEGWGLGQGFCWYSESTLLTWWHLYGWREFKEWHPLLPWTSKPRTLLYRAGWTSVRLKAVSLLYPQALYSGSQPTWIEKKEVEKVNVVNALYIQEWI
jgi:hypothetical protein